MSLINDMLRDLDRRGAGTEVPREPDSHRAGPPDRARRVWPLLLVPLVAVLGVAAWAFWPQTPEPASEAKQQAPKSEAPAEAPREAASEPVPVAEALTGPEPEAPESGSPPGPAEGPEMQAEEATDVERERVESLLAQARQARTRDRLTRPAGDNAFEYYQQILVLVPEHPEAQAGLAAIAQRYRELAESALDRDRPVMARRFLNRARSVRPELPGIAATERRLERARKGDSASEEATETAGNEDAASESGQVAVRRDPEALDRNRAGRAETLRSEGNAQRALTLLRETLADWPAPQTPPFRSATLLAEMQIERGEPEAARATLERFSGWPATLRARLEAQLALQADQPARALALLEQQAPQAEDDARYRALLARVYYTEGKPAKAAEHYRALLSDFGDKPAYWLGLGLARDQLDQRREALEALRRALGSGAYDDRSSVRRYLEGRVRALASQLETGDG